mgnify:CR=1 FL=1
MDRLNLTDEQLHQVIRFLLQRMGQDTRHDLMRHLPMAYIALYPNTARAVRLAVSAGLGEVEGE